MPKKTISFIGAGKDGNSLDLLCINPKMNKSCFYAKIIILAGVKCR